MADCGRSGRLPRSSGADGGRGPASPTARPPELVWLLEHPPLYTAGTSAKTADLLDARFPVFQTGRGGQFTYHGPGQRVAYAMLDLKRRRPDVRAYVAGLEEWIIRTLDAFNVRGDRREDRVGVWVARPDKGAGYEDKIAAIGVRLQRWVSLHGIAINVEPELSHFSGIVPCGVVDPRYGVTSAGRSRPAGDDGRRRRGAEAGVRGGVRGDKRAPAGSNRLNVPRLALRSSTPASGAAYSEATVYRGGRDDDAQTSLRKPVDQQRECPAMELRA